MFEAKQTHVSYLHYVSLTNFSVLSSVLTFTPGNINGASFTVHVMHKMFLQLSVVVNQSHFYDCNMPGSTPNNVIVETSVHKFARLCEQIKVGSLFVSLHEYHDHTVSHFSTDCYNIQGSKPYCFFNSFTASSD